MNTIITVDVSKTAEAIAYQIGLTTQSYDETATEAIVAAYIKRVLANGKGVQLDENGYTKAYELTETAWCQCIDAACREVEQRLGLDTDGTPKN